MNKRTTEPCKKSTTRKPKIQPQLTEERVREIVGIEIARYMQNRLKRQMPLI